MGNSQKTRLLFIDPHEEWLIFVKLTLADDYEVSVAQEFDVLSKAQEKERQFDLIFIGLNLAQENMEKLSLLARTSGEKWCFIVLFPGFPDGKTVRILFRAGMRDLLSKPYDPESLKNVVKEEVYFAKKRNATSKAPQVRDDYESQVHRLWEYVQMTASTGLDMQGGRHEER